MSAIETEQPLLVADGLTKWYGRQPRLPRRLVRTLRGRGDGSGRRVGLRQDHAAAIAVGADRTQCRPNPLSPARRHQRRSVVAERADATVLVPHRLGLRASRPAARPAHGRLGRRQCRRAADGRGPAELSVHSQ